MFDLFSEITHTVHINAIMRSTEWQQKMLRGGLRMTKIKDPSNERRRGKVTEHRTKYPGRLKKTQNNLMSASTLRIIIITWLLFGQNYDTV